MSVPTLAGWLACPRCDRPVERNAGGWRCGGCQVDFADLAGLPWLFAEPGAARGGWQARLHHELARLDQSAARADAALAAEGLAAVTRRRVARLAAAERAQADALRALLQPLLDAAPPAAIETYLALRTRLPLDQGLTTYYPNVHRDWAWGDDENAPAAARVGELLGDPEALLVLGAGAGRLAYDLHQRGAQALTAALDFNPMLLLIADRVARGESVTLHEFPLAPRHVEDVAIERRLAAPAPARPGLAWVLGDALRPPFTGGRFDGVATPWLIDILPAPLATFARIVNRLLRPGGTWVSFGSVAFAGPDPAARLSLEEVLDEVTAAGFEVTAVHADTLPYLSSPASRHGRREETVSFAARKTVEQPPTARYAALPDWLVTGREPVPALPAFQLQAASTRIYAFVMGLIDGRRSIRDMAELMEQQRLMRRDEAEPTIRDFLIRMYDDAARGG